MESLSGLWKKLSLSECEGRHFVVEESDGEKEFFLAARFYIGQMLSMEVIAKTLKGLGTWVNTGCCLFFGRKGMWRRS